MSESNTGAKIELNLKNISYSFVLLSLRISYKKREKSNELPKQAIKQDRPAGALARVHDEQERDREARLEFAIRINEARLENSNRMEEKHSRLL